MNWAVKVARKRSAGVELSARKDHVFAFARTYEGRSCVVIVPRWTAKLMDGVSELPVGEGVWAGTRILLGGSVGTVARMTDAFTGRELPIEDEQADRALRVSIVFAEFPVTVLREA